MILKAFKNNVVCFNIMTMFTLLLAGSLFSQSSENYTMARDGIGQAGGASSSAAYSVRESIGQPSAGGPLSDSRYTFYPGFLRGGMAETGVEDEHAMESAMPKTFQLRQNYPNPFNPATTIEFDLPRRAKVVLDIYDMTGRRLRTLVHGSKPGGTYKITWNGRDQYGKAVASGVYFYRIVIIPQGDDVDKIIYVRKMVMMQ